MALLLQMQQRGREVCAELEQRSKDSRRSWWESEKSEQLKNQEAKGVQLLTKELEALELQVLVAAVHPNVEKEAHVQRLQDLAQLAALQ